MILGIDLAGSQKRNTGICLLKGKKAYCFVVKTDEQILEIVEKYKPEIIAIDAPLSLPKNRKSLEQKSGPHFRECDLELRKLKIKFFPITLGPMRKLTKRGIKLKNLLEKKGYKVIEVFPGATQDILKIPRKQHGTQKLKKALENFGIAMNKQNLTHDELDAITCALTAKLWREGKAIEIGNKREGTIVIPKP